MRRVSSTGRDFYPTPDYVVEALWRHISAPFGATILEPCVGTGRIIEHSPLEHFWRTYDIEPGHYVQTVADFLQEPIDALVYDYCITNPPYNQATEFIKKILHVSRNSAILLPLDTLGSLKRQELMKRESPEVLLFSRRIPFTKKGTPFYSAWFLFGGWRIPNRWSIVD